NRRLYIWATNHPGDYGMHKVGRTTVAIIFAGLLLVPLALAQPASSARAKSGSSSMNSVIATLWAGKTFDQTAISPDGKQVAWVENSKDGSAIFVSAGRSEERRVGKECGRGRSSGGE